MINSLSVLTARGHNAEMIVVGKQSAARRADELLTEDTTLTAQQLVELLRTEADVAHEKSRDATYFARLPPMYFAQNQFSRLHPFLSLTGGDFCSSAHTHLS